MVKEIKQHFDNLQMEIDSLVGLIKGADEFVLVEDVRLAINELQHKIWEARKVFERRDKT